MKKECVFSSFSFSLLFCLLVPFVHLLQLIIGCRLTWEVKSVMNERNEQSVRPFHYTSFTYLCSFVIHSLFSFSHFFVLLSFVLFVFCSFTSESPTRQYRQPENPKSPKGRANSKRGKLKRSCQQCATEVSPCDLQKVALQCSWWIESCIIHEKEWGNSRSLR